MIHQHKALVVDDDPHILDEVSQRLKGNLEHLAMTAQGQKEALELLEKEKRFCYVLLDLEIGMDATAISKSVEFGLSLLNKVREQYSKEQLPVIVMTAHGVTHELSVRAFQAKANDYIKKPFDSDPVNGLEEKIKTLIENLPCHNTGILSVPLDSWEGLEITFLDDFRVDIKVYKEQRVVEQKTLDFTGFIYSEKGKDKRPFEDGHTLENHNGTSHTERRSKPSVLWEMLLHFARNNGILTYNQLTDLWKDQKIREIKAVNEGDAFRTITNRIQGLANGLSKVFKIEESPFTDPRENKTYTTKFKISYPD